MLTIQEKVKEFNFVVEVSMLVSIVYRKLTTIGNWVLLSNKFAHNTQRLERLDEMSMYVVFTSGNTDLLCKQSHGAPFSARNLQLKGLLSDTH